MKFVQGDVACAEGALAAGCDFFAGYPITPATEIMVHIAQKLPKSGGVFIQMEDEIASIMACIGASWAGAKAMTATSGPGFSLMQEGIGYAIMTETPLVLVDIQRSGPSTGQATMPMQGDVMQARYGSHGDYSIIALAPSSVQEMYDLTARAFHLSESIRTPVILLADEILGHMWETIELRRVKTAQRKISLERWPSKTFLDEDVAPMPVFGNGARALVTGSTHDEYGIRRVDDPADHKRVVSTLKRKLEKRRDEIILFEEFYTEGADTVVISYGAPFRSAIDGVRAARRRGKRAGCIKLQTIWPFPLEELGLERFQRVLVAEMNTGMVSKIVRGEAIESISEVHPSQLIEEALDGG
jgi:2-oxoglutarate ferredoxin oxidoreductase subunit alpha